MRTKTLMAIMVLASVLLLLFNPVSSNADSLTLDIGAVIPGQTVIPGGTPPYLTAAFVSSTPGTVTLTLTAPGLVGTEKVTEWDFNLNPALYSFIPLTFTHVSGTQAASSISQLANTPKADGDGYFDISFLFPTSGDTFNAGDSSVYTITGDSITASSFNYLSSSTKNSDTNDGFPTVAHIQSIGATGAGSSWVSVPEPGILILLGIAMSAVGVASRYVRKI